MTVRFSWALSGWRGRTTGDISAASVIAKMNDAGVVISANDRPVFHGTIPVGGDTKGGQIKVVGGDTDHGQAIWGQKLAGICSCISEALRYSPFHIRNTCEFGALLHCNCKKNDAGMVSSQYDTVFNCR